MVKKVHDAPENTVILWMKPMGLFGLWVINFCFAFAKGESSTNSFQNQICHRGIQSQQLSRKKKRERLYSFIFIFKKMSYLTTSWQLQGEELVSRWTIRCFPCCVNNWLIVMWSTQAHPSIFKSYISTKRKSIIPKWSFISVFFMK